MTAHVCLVKNEKCGTDAIEEHTCPFEEDVHGDSETKCRCCETCEHECGQDI